MRFWPASRLNWVTLQRCPHSVRTSPNSCRGHSQTGSPTASSSSSPARPPAAVLLADVHLTIESDGQVKDMTELSDGLRALFALALYDLVSESAQHRRDRRARDPSAPHQPAEPGPPAREGQQPEDSSPPTRPDVVGAFPPDTSSRSGPAWPVVQQPATGFLTDDAAARSSTGGSATSSSRSPRRGSSRRGRLGSDVVLRDR